MRARLAAVAAAAVLTLTACGGSDEPAADCLDAEATGDRIASGANETPITPTGAQAVQSETSEVYYVAMTFTVPGDDEPATGIWATDDLEDGSILSVDALAKQFTDWPDAEQAFDITYPNDGTKAAESCVTG